jgi:hypothetical protein
MVNKMLFVSQQLQNKKRIRKVSTVSEYFRSSVEILISHMRTVFLIRWQATDANTKKADNV